MYYSAGANTAQRLIARLVLSACALAALAAWASYRQPGRAAAAQSQPRAALTNVSDMIVVSDGARGTVIYAADESAHAVFLYRLTSPTSQIKYEQFEPLRASVEFAEPAALAYRGGKLLVADSKADVLYEVDVETGRAVPLLGVGAAPGLQEMMSVAALGDGGVAVGFDHGDSVGVVTPGAAGARLNVLTADVIGSPDRIASAGSSLLVLDRGSSTRTIYRVPLAGGAAPTKLLERVSGLEDFAFYGGVLYLATETGIQALPEGNNQEPRQVSVGDADGVSASRIAANELSLFVADTRSRSVLVRPRPAPIRQMQASGDSFVWLDTVTNSVYRGRRAASSRRSNQSPTQKNAEPFSAQKNVQFDAGELLWAGGPSPRPIAVTARDDGMVYVADRTEQGEAVVYEVERPNEARQMFAGSPLRQPLSIAAAKDRLYILDGASQKIYCLNPARREIFEEVISTPVNPFPERLLYSDGQLVALNSYSKVLHRFAVGDYPPPPEAPGDDYRAETLRQPGGDWTVVKPGKISTLRYLDKSELGVSLDSVADFSVADGDAYFLDAVQRRIGVLPLGGGEMTWVGYEDFSASPSAIAAGPTGVYLADGFRNDFARMPQMVPYAFDFIGAWGAPEMMNLYRYLHEAGLLPRRKYTTPAETSLEALAVAQGVTPVRYTEEFQCLFCEMNPGLCNERQQCPVPRQVKAAEPLNLLPAQSNVFLPDVSVLTLTPSRPIVLPLSLSPDDYPERFFGPLYKGTLEDVASFFIKGTKQGSELARDLKEMNNDYQGANILGESQGDFIISVLAARAKVSMPKADLLNPPPPLRDVMANKNVKGLYLNHMPAPKSAGHAAPELAAAPAAAEPVVTNPRCLPIDAEVWTQAMWDAHYCLPDRKDFGRVEVGVIDNVFDPNHQAFSDPDDTEAFHLYQSEFNLRHRARPPGPVQFSVDLDHGTHIAGLIAGREHEHGMMGVFPYAKLYAMTVVDLEPATTQWKGINIFNISLGELIMSKTEEEGGAADADERDAVKQARRALKEFTEVRPKTLFVVAAGNERGKVKAEALAAKGAVQNNVITVAAAEDRRHRLDDSNFGPAVSVFAPGNNLRSSLYDNLYGATSGTSQATAFVTGAAAMLKGLRSHWLPWQLKFRLLATADLWPVADDTRSGLLNVERAVLDPDKLVITYSLKEAGDDGQCRGLISNADLEKELVIEKQGSESSKIIQMGKLLRMWRDPNSPENHSVFSVVWYEGEEGNFGSNLRPRRLDGIEGSRFRMFATEAGGKRVDIPTSFMFESSPQTAKCGNMEVNLLELDDFVNTFAEETD
jgi:hypothetical protein